MIENIETNMSNYNFDSFNRLHYFILTANPITRFTAEMGRCP